MPELSPGVVIDQVNEYQYDWSADIQNMYKACLKLQKKQQVAVMRKS